MARSEDIRRAALNLFAQKGYDATSIQDITSSVNIKKATFYSHFQSKNELFILLMKEQSESIINKTNVALNESKATDLKGLLFDVFNAQVRMNFDRTHLLFWKRAVLTQAGMTDNELQTQLSAIMGKVNETITSAIMSSLSKVKAELSMEYTSKCMCMFLVLLQGYLDWILITNNLDEDHAKLAWDCMWNGMQELSRK